MEWLKNLFCRKTVTASKFMNGHGKWQWHIRATNGEILCHSEEYSTKKACDDTVKMLDGKRIRVITI